jgi:hypothetical protein
MSKAFMPHKAYSSNRCRDVTLILRVHGAAVNRNHAQMMAALMA